MAAGTMLLKQLAALQVKGCQITICNVHCFENLDLSQTMYICTYVTEIYYRSHTQKYFQKMILESMKKAEYLEKLRMDHNTLLTLKLYQAGASLP